MYLVLSDTEAPGDKSFRMMKLFKVPDNKPSAFVAGTREMAMYTLADDTMAEMLRAMAFFNERIFADAVNHNDSTPKVCFNVDTCNPRRS